MRTWWLVASASLLTACISGLEEMPPGGAPTGSDGSGNGGVISTPTDFDNAMLQTASTYRTDFSRVNSAPYASALGAFDINLFVHGDSRVYRAIHPETTSTSNVDISVGTVIVREVLDPSGAVTKLTMMAKGPAGYDPTLGDWWFAVTDPSGKQVLSDDTGLQVGRLAACHSCHVPRASSDFLFGVPSADETHH